MARPRKNGLLYFSFDTDFFFADRRIRALQSRFGSDGIVLLIWIWSEIYRERGYYMIWDDQAMDAAVADLGIAEGLIKQVMEYLYSRSLLTQISILAISVTIITSPGIQKRYQEAVKGQKRDFEVAQEIWLLKKEETATFIKVTQNPSFSEKNPSYSEKNPTKEKKEKEIKINKKESGAKAPVSENVSDSLFDNCKVDQAFKEYMDHRKKMKSPMTDRAIVLAVKKLKELSFDGVGIFDPDIAVQIIENSIQNGWKGLFPLKKTAPIEARRGVSGDKFDNFTPRDGGNINDQMLKKTMKKLEGGT